MSYYLTTYGLAGTSNSNNAMIKPNSPCIVISLLLGDWLAVTRGSTTSSKLGNPPLLGICLALSRMSEAVSSTSRMCGSPVSLARMGVPGQLILIFL